MSSRPQALPQAKATYLTSRELPSLLTSNSPRRSNFKISPLVKKVKKAYKLQFGDVDPEELLRQLQQRTLNGSLPTTSFDIQGLGQSSEVIHTPLKGGKECISVLTATLPNQKQPAPQKPVEAPPSPPSPPPPPKPQSPTPPDVHPQEDITTLGTVSLPLTQANLQTFTSLPIHFDDQMPALRNTPSGLPNGRVAVEIPRALLPLRRYSTKATETTGPILAHQRVAPPTFNRSFRSTRHSEQVRKGPIVCLTPIQSSGHPSVPRNTPFQQPTQTGSVKQKKVTPAQNTSEGKARSTKSKGSKTTQGVRLFSRMSSEAQTAINETRKEMGLPELSKEATKMLQLQEANLASARGQPQTIPVYTQQWGPLQQTPRDLRASCPGHFHLGSSSSVKASTAAKDPTAASEVFNGNPGPIDEDDLVKPPTPVRPLSGMTIDQVRFSEKPGRLKLRSEITFEITPPGFDARYRDIFIPDPNIAETPDEIISKSVAKCSDWLSKYG